MSERSGFFPYVDGDANTEYDNSFLARILASFIGNGVYDGSLAVAAGDHMQVVIPAGQAWVNGYYYRNDGNFSLPIANADGVLPRKDTVVLRWDINVRSITAQVLTGSFSSSPVAPAIVRDSEQFDLKLAEITVAPGTTAITQAAITDTRLDKTVCGIVTGFISQVDTTTFYNQIQGELAKFKARNEAEFVLWFQGLRDVLDEDTAGNLLNLIQAHEADYNNPHQVTSAQTGAVQGNTKSWVATSVSISPNHMTVQLTIPDFVFCEGCQVSFLAPEIPLRDPNYKLQIGTKNYLFRLLTHENMSGDEWAANTIVTVSLSSQLIPNGGSPFDGTAFFKGGAGNVRDMYDFPLTFQKDTSAAPTPLNTNHIWIENDTPMDLIKDEAMRDSYDNIYLLKEDNTNNKSLDLTACKITTSGQRVNVLDRYIGRDTDPWVTASNHQFAAGSQGKNNSISAASKWPMIYSKINGVVEMETAHRWDGNAWQFLSQSGRYVFDGSTNVIAEAQRLFNRTGDALSLHSQIPSTRPVTANCAKFSKDRNYLFYGASTTVSGLGLQILKRNKDMFNQQTFSFATTLYNVVFDIAESNDGIYLALACGSGVVILKKQNDGTWIELTRWPATSCFCVAWSPDGSQLAYGSSTSVMLESRVGDTFSLAHQVNISNMNTGTFIDLAYSLDGSVLLFANNNVGSTYVHMGSIRPSEGVLLVSYVASALATGFTGGQHTGLSQLSTGDWFYGHSGGALTLTVNSATGGISYTNNSLSVSGASYYSKNESNDEFYVGCYSQTDAHILRVSGTGGTKIDLPASTYSSHVGCLCG